MAEARIPVDLLNPGQVFACLGFLEAADILLGDTAGGFDWTEGTDATFILRAAGEKQPVEAVLAFLSQAKAKIVAPGRYSDEEQAKLIEVCRKGKTLDFVLTSPRDSFPFPIPKSPAPLPVRLESSDASIDIAHWGETVREPVKFWGGSGGYPGAALARDALKLLPADPVALAADPFSFAALQSSSFRLDWRRDYIPADAGFSPNAHSDLSMLGFPIVELLATIGLSHARPRLIDEMEYRYGAPGVVAGATLPPCLFRPLLDGGLAIPGLPTRRFRMCLGRPSKMNRAITEVIEETET